MSGKQCICKFLASGVAYNLLYCITVLSAKACCVKIFWRKNPQGLTIGHLHLQKYLADRLPGSISQSEEAWPSWAWACEIYISHAVSGNTVSLAETYTARKHSLLFQSILAVFESHHSSYCTKSTQAESPTDRRFSSPQNRVLPVDLADQIWSDSIYFTECVSCCSLVPDSAFSGIKKMVSWPIWPGSIARNLLYIKLKPFKSCNSIPSTEVWKWVSGQRHSSLILSIRFQLPSSTRPKCKMCFLLKVWNWSILDMLTFHVFKWKNVIFWFEIYGKRPIAAKSW